MQVASICQQATECWWRDNHSGWMIYARGSRQFESLDQVLGHAQGLPEPPQPSQWDPQHPPAQVSFTQSAHDLEVLCSCSMRATSGESERDPWPESGPLGASRASPVGSPAPPYPGQLTCCTWSAQGLLVLQLQYEVQISEER